MKRTQLRKMIREAIDASSNTNALVSYGTFARLVRQMSPAPWQERALTALERFDDDDHGRSVAEWCQLLNDEATAELQKSIENIRAVDRAHR